MTRLAFLSPLPPSPTGIADYSAEVLALLSPRYSIDCFHDQALVDPLGPPIGLYDAALFPDRHAREPYDLPVYQLGNGSRHQFLYPLIERFPGLLVLHDLVLHHSRAQFFLDSPEVRAYRADPSNSALRDAALAPLSRYREELVRAYPREGERVAEAQLGTVGTLLPYAYPFFELPVRHSRVVLVHNQFMARRIEEAVPGARVRVAPMPVAPFPTKPGEAAGVRARLGLAPDDLVVASFGLLTPEKQLETVARCVARAAVAFPHVRLLLVGEVPDRSAVEAMLVARGVRERTVLTGRVPFPELGSHLEASDIVMHLRYPTARETSAALMRVLAQGRPTVMTDLENLAEIPEDVVLRADPADEEGDATRALLRLGEQEDLRRALGARAAAFIREFHSPERARAAYEDAIGEAIKKA